jgi:hypothetical protein
MEDFNNLELNPAQLQRLIRLASETRNLHYLYIQPSYRLCLLQSVARMEEQNLVFLSTKLILNYIWDLKKIQMN